MTNKSLFVAKFYKTNIVGSGHTPVSYWILVGGSCVLGLIVGWISNTPEMFWVVGCAILVSVLLQLSGEFEPLYLETKGIRYKKKFVPWEDLVLTMVPNTYPEYKECRYWLVLSEGKLQYKTRKKQQIFKLAVTKENLQLLFRFYNKKVEVVDLGYRPTSHFDFKKQDPDGLIAKHNAKIDTMAMENNLSST